MTSASAGNPKLCLCWCSQQEHGAGQHFPAWCVGIFWGNNMGYTLFLLDSMDKDILFRVEGGV